MSTEAPEDSSWLQVPSANRPGPGIPDVGALFRSYRRVHRMTQAGLASYLGLDQSYVSKIEKGDRQVRDVKVLQWIGTRLNIPLEDVGLSPYLGRACPAEPGNTALATRLLESQRQWRLVRRSLNQRRLELTRIAAELYPDADRVGGTGLLTRPGWMPGAPVDLADVRLTLTPAPVPPLTGTEPQAASVRPLGANGMPYDRYTRAIRDCDRPALFENRLSFRLTGLDWSTGRVRRPGMTFGHTTYFEMIDVCEAVAHELAAAHFGRKRPRGGRDVPPVTLADLPFRKAIGTPFDLNRRSLLPSINTLTLRRSRTGAAFMLHWRDPAQVAVAGGMFHVMPAGVFQPASIAPDAQTHDFDLWRNVMREFSEEFLGNPEHDGSSGVPVDYENTEPFRSLDAARAQGALRVSCVGVGIDPLTLAGEILTVAVVDDHVFDRVFAGMTPSNTEGTVVAAPNRTPAEGVPFTGPNVQRLLTSGLMAPAAAACLDLAWRHRGLLLGGHQAR